MDLTGIFNGVIEALGPGGLVGVGCLIGIVIIVYWGSDDGRHPLDDSWALTLKDKDGNFPKSSD